MSLMPLNSQNKKMFGVETTPQSPTQEMKRGQIWLATHGGLDEQERSPC